MKKTIEDYAIQAMSELINTIDLFSPEERFIECDPINATHFSIGAGEPTPIHVGKVLFTTNEILSTIHHDNEKHFIEVPREQRVAKQAFKYAKAMMDEQEKNNDRK